MSIEWFESPDEQSVEVPWLKDFIASGGDYDTPLAVDCLVTGLKGILVLTAEYKGFIFKGSNLHSQVLEALEEYVKSDSPLPRLIACGSEAGKVQLGIDHDDNTCTWKKDGSNYRQLYDDPENARLAELKKRNNPLLPSPREVNGKAPKTSQAATQSKKSS